MSPETWPSPQARFDRPPKGDADSAERWRRAVDAALLAGTLILEPLGERVYRLSGHCPRCGHDTSQDVSFPTDDERSSTAITVVCSCDYPHAQPHGDERGCGWAPNVDLPLVEPVGHFGS